MKPSTDLFDLIKSLTGSEKRYFRLSTSLQQGNKEYLKLFDAIDSQKVYDEKAIKLRFKKESGLKNITFTKNYLHKLIFRSLNSFNEERSIDSQLTNILNRCRILLDKGLIKQYFKTVKLGKQLAVKHERFSFILEFLEIERQLTKKEELSKNDINDVYIEENKILDKIRNLNEFKRAVNILFKIQRTSGVVRTKTDDENIDRILKSLDRDSGKNKMSVLEMETYYFAMYIANEIKGDHEKAYYFIKKRFKTVKSNKGIFQNSLFNNYKDSYLKMITAASDSGRYKEAEELFGKFIREFGKAAEQDIDVSFTHFDIMLNKSINTEIKTGSLKHFPELERDLEKHKNKITINTYNGFYFKLSKYYFLKSEFNEALRIINALFASRHLKFSPFIEPYVRMLNILIHYELGNIRLMNYLISSTTKYLKSKNKYYKTENVVLNYLKKSGQRNSSASGHKEIVKDFYKEINKLKRSEFEKNAFSYFDYTNWIERKLLINLK